MIATALVAPSSWSYAVADREISDGIFCVYQAAAITSAPVNTRSIFISISSGKFCAVQWSEVPGHVLTALLEALPAPPESRPTAEDRRRQLAERIALSQHLPRGVRERLANTLESVRFDDRGRDEPALRLSDAVALLEETLPAQLLLAGADVQAATHPRGDSFFTGDARSLSDDDARRIAAEQLARSGFRRSSPTHSVSEAP